MDQASSSQSPATSPLEFGVEELQLRVDFFRKLGYSPTAVRAALKKVGLSTDTNSVLGELVRVRAGTNPSAANPENEERATGQNDPLAMPGWSVGPQRVSPPPLSAPPQQEDRRDTDVELKNIVIDGSNVAMSHGNKDVFSCRGIQLAVNYFLDRGHTNITVFVPSWRKENPRPDAPIRDQHMLADLEKRKIVVFTPSRRVGGKRVVCYDDRFIVKLAYESGGVIVSNDTYRDLQEERPEWKKCIEERLLMYSFVNDKFMPPDDPLGRHGPTLDNFLRKKPQPAEQRRQLCPYDKKCTYGIKCKFYHPERANQSYRSLADELRENARMSTGKDDKNTILSPRGVHSDPGAAPHHYLPSLEYELEHKLSLDQRSSPRPGQMSENTVLYRESCRAGRNHTPASTAESQREWPGLHPVADHPYASIPHEFLDSGLGSYDSQYSEIAHGHSKPYRLRPQQQAGPRHPAVHVERQNTPPPCRCCSHAAPSATLDRRSCSPNPEHRPQPRYDTYPPHLYQPSMHHHYSLPGHLHHSGSHHQHLYPQKYWSDPFQGISQTRTPHNIPNPSHPPAQLCPSYCYGGEHQHHPWATPPPPPPPPPTAFDPERVELRKKLQAIFNPSQVDAVMEMFPHLKDAQKLAAEILNLKSQGRIF